MEEKFKWLPTGNNILFEFVDETAGGKFKPSLSERIILSCDDLDKQGTSRWGKVLSVGPRVNEEITVGKFILIEPLKWTTSITMEDNISKFWKTNDAMVMAVSDVQVRQY